MISDPTQSILLTRDVVRPELVESTMVDVVDSSEDQSLERIVAAERDMDETGDLLLDDCPKE